MKEENTRKKLMLMKQGDLIKKVDTEFQLMRRMQEADENGICECISCGRKYHFKQMDGGHFIAKSSKGNFGVRYEPTNVFPQCTQCNYYLSGNVAAYEDRLILKIGKEKVDWLKANKELPMKVWLRGKLIDVYILCKSVNKQLSKLLG